MVRIASLSLLLVMFKHAFSFMPVMTMTHIAYLSLLKNLNTERERDCYEVANMIQYFSVLTNHPSIPS